MPIGSSQWMYASGADFTIPYSCRFDGSSAYLSKTFSGASNRKTMTWSFWVKFASQGKGSETASQLWGDAQTGYPSHRIAMHAEVMKCICADDAAQSNKLALESTNRKFRDYSSWYHFVFAVDTTQSVAANRIKVWVNGVNETTGYGWVQTVDCAQDFDTHFSSGLTEYIGRYATGAYVHGFLAEYHFIDGTAYDADDFGETGDYGEWKAKEVEGLTYGTNGFYLDFSDSAALGDDAANSNDWTVNGATAVDQMLDSPTNNFPILNYLYQYSATAHGHFSQGNLRISDDTNYLGNGATFGVSSGKWYWEVFVERGASSTHLLGIIDISKGRYDNNSLAVQDHLNGYGYYGGTGNKVGTGQSLTAYGDSWTTDDLIGVALDLDAGTIKFYKNNTVQDSGTAAFTGITGTYSPWVEEGTGGDNVDLIFNFGQDSSFNGEKTAQGNADGGSIGDFYYSPPSGYLAMCTQNLPTPAVKPNENFNTVLYTGNASSLAVTGAGFQPDLLWLKGRSVAQHHCLFDAVRGATTGNIKPNLTDAQAAQSKLASFDSDGFTLNTGSSESNGNTETYASWLWKAGNATLGTGDFTQGSIASTCSRNVDAGFSIVQYEATGSAGTVGHGLSKAPEFIIVKHADQGGTSWVTYYGDNTDYVKLNASTASADDINAWNDTSPTATVFSIGPSGGDTNNSSGGTTLAYCFHTVDGFSKFGTYTAGGYTFIYTGFSPAWLLIKRVGSGNWTMLDNRRATNPGNIVNPIEEYFAANTDDAEANHQHLDFVSNGIKMAASGGDFNGNGNDYMYLAFAETPFKYANAQ